jgi:hypothetical protein
LVVIPVPRQLIELSILELESFWQHRNRASQLIDYTSLCAMPLMLQPTVRCFRKSLSSESCSSESDG